MTAPIRLNTDGWREAERWILASIECPESERVAFLASECPPHLLPLVRKIGSQVLAESWPFELQPEWIDEAMDVLATKPRWSGERRMENQLGRFEVIRLLGTGGMGDVYLVRHVELGASCALKVMRIDVVTDEAVLRFRRERIVLSALDSPSIPRLLDVGTTEDGRPYFVMEYFDGLPLTEGLKKWVFDLEGRLGVFLKICDAVAHIHHRLVVHRDLKPANILLSESGDVCILDFGIATFLLPSSAVDERAAMYSEGAESAAAALAITQDGSGPLTRKYAAPEQVNGGSVTAAADVYALGVLLSEIVSGTPEAPGPELISLCAKATHADPARRFATASELREAALELI